MRISTSGFGGDTVQPITLSNPDKILAAVTPGKQDVPAAEFNLPVL